MANAHHPWHFFCGVCHKLLNDSTALFTSCGHFFCAKSPSCTRLTPGTGAGRCEQCSNQCNAGTLENRGAKHDERVRSFVFKDLKQELKTFAEILDFRDKHLAILAENADSEAKRNHNLKAEYATQAKENRVLQSQIDKLRAENKALRTQNNSFRQMNQVDTRVANARIPRAPHALPKQVLGSSSTRLNTIRADDSLRDTAHHRQSHSDRHRMQDSVVGSGLYGNQQPYPTRSTNILHGTRNFDEPRSMARPSRYSVDIRRDGNNHAAGSSINEATKRPLKRRWETQADLAASTKKRSRRIQPPPVPAKRSYRASPSVVAAGHVQRSASRFTSSKPTALNGLSRFARGAGSNSIRGNILRGARTEQPGDWQRRVSSVPRPSATPDRLGQSAPKRNRHGINPLARW